MSTGLHMTEDEYLQLKTRLDRVRNTFGKPSNFISKELSSPNPCLTRGEGRNGEIEPEKTLQAKAQKYCDGHGYVWFHDRSRKCNRRGFPDLVIAMPGGRTVWIEFKSATGRLRKEQVTERDKLEAMGHEWHLVRSFKEFLEVLR